MKMKMRKWQQIDAGHCCCLSDKDSQQKILDVRRRKRREREEDEDEKREKAKSSKSREKCKGNQKT